MTTRLNRLLRVLVAVACFLIPMPTGPAFAAGLFRPCKAQHCRQCRLPRSRRCCLPARLRCCRCAEPCDTTFIQPAPAVPVYEPPLVYEQPAVPYQEPTPTWVPSDEASSAPGEAEVPLPSLPSEVETPYEPTPVPQPETPGPLDLMPPDGPHGLDAPDTALQEQLDEARRRARELEEENERADEQLAKMRELNEAVKQQLSDLKAAKEEAARPPIKSLPISVTKDLEDLADRHPKSYQFDSATGISRFDADVLFDTGRDELRPEAVNLLDEFADVFKKSDARDLRIQIDGHTDNQPIGQPETYAKHPTNWHLSIHRAEAVQRYLESAGLPSGKMHVAGYSLYRPIASNDTAEGRQRNRRVEIRVLSPDSTAPENPQAPRLPETFSGAPVSPADGFLPEPDSGPQPNTAQRRLNVPTAAQAWRAAETLRQ